MGTPQDAYQEWRYSDAAMLINPGIPNLESFVAGAQWALNQAIERVVAVHPTRRVQIGSKTHGGGPEYGNVCTHCHTTAPCRTMRELIAGERT